MKPPAVTIIDAIKDPRLIGDTISPQQETVLRVVYGLPLPPEKFRTRIFDGPRMARKGSFKWIEEAPLEFLNRIAGREISTYSEFKEAGIYFGARGGKSDKIASNIGIYEALFRQHRLSRGERALIPCIAVDKKQAGVIFNYIKGKLQSSETLADMIENIRSEEIELANKVTIGVYPCAFRQIRGYSVPAAVCDELAVWRDLDTGANPAKEVIRALRRGMLTFPEAKLVKVSSPFAKTGVVWEDYQSREKKLKSLIIKVPSWEVNPVLTEDSLLEELETDPDLFWREFGAEFWDAISPLVPGEKVDACIATGVKERPYSKAHSYIAVVDVAFRQDAFAFGICHRDGSKVVWDRLVAWEGTKNDAVNMNDALAEIAMVCRNYLVSLVWGDQYCAEPIRQGLHGQGLDFREFVFTQNSKQQLYGNMRSLFISNCEELLDDQVTANEIKTLEAITGTMGLIRVQATAGYKDDRATVVALGSYIAMLDKGSAQAWISAFRGMLAGSKPVSAASGRTACCDCGKTIPLGEEYFGVGPGLGQCMACAADHGRPTYAAVKKLTANEPKVIEKGSV